MGLGQELHALVSRSGEYCVALRSGRVYAERLVPQQVPALRRSDLGAPDVTAVVSGGTQGLGMAFTKQV